VLLSSKGVDSAIPRTEREGLQLLVRLVVEAYQKGARGGSTAGRHGRHGPTPAGSAQSLFLPSKLFLCSPPSPHSSLSLLLLCILLLLLLLSLLSLLLPYYYCYYYIPSRVIRDNLYITRARSTESAVAWEITFDSSPACAHKLPQNTTEP
jgi:hypothetical protein